MASILSFSSTSLATLSFNSGVRATTTHQMKKVSTMGSSVFSGLKQVNKVQLKKATKVTFTRSAGINTTISCSVAQPETLHIVQCTIAKQLSIDETTVTPKTKFSELGADSLDTVEIMMALEEKFDISIGEGGAENISTVQDAADLIEKVKTAST
ncbi:acyl carrier protein [Vigna unguiculata]|uniref:Acyl carrier protein n=1 Tax=Vigna unguiculata TaxID=3917 RepID=A0A4D6MLK6_VIGUN|nr:acyl carrier protein [Vigna unguiculata]